MGVGNEDTTRRARVPSLQSPHSSTPGEFRVLYFEHATVSKLTTQLLPLKFDFYKTLKSLMYSNFAFRLWFFGLCHPALRILTFTGLRTKKSMRLPAERSSLVRLPTQSSRRLVGRRGFRATRQLVWLGIAEPQAG